MAEEAAEHVAPRRQDNPPVRPVVLPETFNGEGNWGDWVKHFFSVAAVNHWSKQEQLWLRVRLVGRTATALRRVPEGAKDDFSRWLDALKNVLIPVANGNFILQNCWPGRRSEVRIGPHSPRISSF